MFTGRPFIGLEYYLPFDATRAQGKLTISGLPPDAQIQVRLMDNVSTLPKQTFDVTLSPKRDEATCQYSNLIRGENVLEVLITSNSEKLSCSARLALMDERVVLLNTFGLDWSILEYLGEAKTRIMTIIDVKYDPCATNPPEHHPASRFAIYRILAKTVDAPDGEYTVFRVTRGELDDVFRHINVYSGNVLNLKGWRFRSKEPLRSIKDTFVNIIEQIRQGFDPEESSEPLLWQ